ncbi:POTRA domain-containing protein [Chryseobacterium paludis]|uniref:POTRA domain-containing protein n=1 Tax=Chryseobacterium paludis TaxID=2956784 RepID=UPI0021C17881|nr:POTRA domain-containing protein [Chryseobacterium paludis]
MTRSIVILIMLISGFSFLNAQEKKDSLYYKIEEFSDQRKVTKFIHRLIFRREADSASVKSRTEKMLQETYNKKYIRKIRVETIDPFGYGSKDNKEKLKWYDWLIDHLHSNTKTSTVNNYLLFKEGEEYNAQKLYESERLLRTMPFINRVNISVSDSTSSKDSIDVVVKVLDSWSLKPRVSYSGSKIGLGVTEENVLGLGHTLDFLYRNDSKEKQNYLLGSYTAYNLFGSYINAQVLGERDFFRNERINFNVRRDFFSPLTRWAGGFTFEYFMRNVLLPIETDTTYPEVQIKVFSQDLWGGYQIPISSDPSEKVSSNISVVGRFQNYQYKDSPESDQYKYFSSYNSFLMSIGFIHRNFSVQKNIFQYDLPEDIAYGNSVNFTAGGLSRSNDVKPYVGISGSYGQFTKLGYFNLKAEFGRFFNEDDQNRESFRLDGTYFTHLMDWKFAKVRHFFSPTLALGNPQHNYTYKDRINLSSADEFPVYNSDYIGTKKLVLRYQLQLFINKTWKNFHFSPYLTAAVGWLGMPDDKLLKTNANTKIGIGVLINNPFLVFNRIQISFTYYPRVPFDNNSVFDFNSNRNNLLPINNFGTDIPHFVNFGN